MTKKICYFLVFSIPILSCSKIDNEIETVDYEAEMMERYMPLEPRTKEIEVDGYAINVVDGTYVFQGDILLTEEQANSIGEVLDGIYSYQEPAAYAAAVASRYLWPDNKVLFTFGSDFINKYRSQTNVTDTQAEYIIESLVKAMNYYQNALGIEFINVFSEFISRDDKVLARQRTKNYIQFVCGKGSWSYLGRICGRQELSLDPSWAHFGTALHELGHALGLVHEQSKPDRDNYIKIHYDNIRSDWKSEYNKSNNAKHIVAGFDFESIMLYSSYAGTEVAINTKLPVMTKLGTNSTWDAQRYKLSEKDVCLLGILYSSVPNKYILPREVTATVNGITTTSVMNWIYNGVSATRPPGSGTPKPPGRNPGGRDIESDNYITQ